MLKSSRLRTGATALIAASALLLAGCAKSVVGKWKGDVPSPMGPIAVTTEFKSDGSFTQTGGAKGKTINTTGTYKVEKENLSMETKDVTIDGKSLMSIIPPAMQGQIKSQMNQTGTFKIEGDNLEFNAGGKSQTLTRVKE